MNKLQRIIIGSKPIQFVKAQTQKIILPGFQNVPLYNLLVFYIKQLTTTNISMRASAIAYNLIIALPAGLLFLFTIVPHLPKALRSSFNDQLIKLITASFTPNTTTATWIKSSINDFINIQRGGLSLLGFLLVLWATSNAMMGIMDSFDNTLKQKRQTSFLGYRLTAIKLTSLLIILVIACVSLLITETVLLKYLVQIIDLEKNTLTTLVKIFDFIIITIVSNLAIGAIYRYAPSTHKRWHIVTPGSILTTLLLLVTTYLLSFYISNFSNYNKLYGSVGTVLILMLIIYFNSVVLLIGFELNNTITTLGDSQLRKAKKYI